MLLSLLGVPKNNTAASRIFQAAAKWEILGAKLFGDSSFSSKSTGGLAPTLAWIYVNFVEMYSNNGAVSTLPTIPLQNSFDWELLLLALFIFLFFMMLFVYSFRHRRRIVEVEPRPGFEEVEPRN
jgi:hypothetical protein